MQAKPSLNVVSEPFKIEMGIMPKPGWARAEFQGSGWRVWKIAEPKAQA